MNKRLPAALLTGMLLALHHPACASGQDPAEKRSERMLARGLAAAGNGRYEEAAGWFERAVVANPANAFAYARLGRAEAALGQKDRALKYYGLALTIEPSQPDALFWSARLDWLSGARDEAGKKLEMLHRTCPDCRQTKDLEQFLSSDPLSGNPDVRASGR